MGRPKKSRKKEPEEKKGKDGLKKVTKHGVTMHCSICGAADHNKKGHHNHVNDEPKPIGAEESEEEYDDPSIIAVIYCLLHSAFYIHDLIYFASNDHSIAAFAEHYAT